MEQEGAVTYTPKAHFLPTAPSYKKGGLLGVLRREFARGRRPRSTETPKKGFCIAGDRGSDALFEPKPNPKQTPVGSRLMFVKMMLFLREGRGGA